MAAGDIPPYFGVSQSTVGTKAKQIWDMFGLGHWHPEFSTQRMLDPELQEELRRLGIE